jgi:hypothetical protein
MATGISMITRAMRLCGALGEGEIPTDQEAQDCLSAMNTMLDSWSIERMFVYYIVSEQLTMVPSQATYTMGSGGDLDTTRPTRIDDSCFIRYAGIDTPLQLLDADGYAAIICKTIESNIPWYLFPDYQYPLVRLSFYTVPSSASAVAHIKSWKQLQQFTSLTDALALPPGYQRAIEYSLSEEVAPEFGQPVPPKVEKTAMRARANVKRINAPAPIMRSEAGAMSAAWPIGRNIYTG